MTLNPEDPAAHGMLGRVLAVQGKIGDARAEFERSLQIDPGYGQAREDLERIGRLGGLVKWRPLPTITVS